jgi:hypothetical protein
MRELKYHIEISHEQLLPNLSESTIYHAYILLDGIEFLRLIHHHEIAYERLLQNSAQFTIHHVYILFDGM